MKLQMIFVLIFEVIIHEEDISEITDTSVNDKVEICNITAFFDCTWQRRGYASLNSVIAAISIKNRTFLAYEFQTKNCKSFEMWDLQKGTGEHDSFFIKPTNAKKQ